MKKILLKTATIALLASSVGILGQIPNSPNAEAKSSTLPKSWRGTWWQRTSETQGGLHAKAHVSKTTITTSSFKLKVNKIHKKNGHYYGSLRFNGSNYASVQIVKTKKNLRLYGKYYLNGFRNKKIHVKKSDHAVIDVKSINAHKYSHAHSYLQFTRK